eukprot:6155022-Amphidinium_carterae.1
MSSHPYGQKASSTQVTPEVCRALLTFRGDQNLATCNPVRDRTALAPHRLQLKRLDRSSSTWGGGSRGPSPQPLRG